MARAATILCLVIAWSSRAWCFLSSPPHHPRAITQVRATTTAVRASPPPTLERQPNSSVLINIEVSEDDSLESFEQAAADFAKRATIRGFRKGSKVPTQVVVGELGAEAVKSKAIQDISDRAIARIRSSNDIQLIGQSKIEGGEDSVIAVYSPGKPFHMAIRCDVWPTLEWTGELGKDISIEYELDAVPQDRIQSALDSIRERYLVAKDTPDGYEAAFGDCVFGDMMGYVMNDDGTKGTALPAVASGEGVEIVLEQGRFMPGLVEGLVGAKAGDTVDVRVEFPKQATRTLTPELAGKPALFEVKVSAVKQRSLPELNDDFANSVREGLTYDELYKEVRNAVGEEGDRRNKEKRNVKIEEALVSITKCEIPETMINEQTKEKFAVMMSEQRDSGVPDEEIKKMITKEGFEKYKKVAYKNVYRTLAANIAIDDLAQREGLSFNPDDVEDQVGLMKAQAEQRNEPFEENMVRGRLESTLKRDTVLEWISERITINEIGPKN